MGYEASNDGKNDYDKRDRRSSSENSERAIKGSSSENSRDNRILTSRFERNREKSDNSSGDTTKKNRGSSSSNEATQYGRSRRRDRNLDSRSRSRSGRGGRQRRRSSSSRENRNINRKYHSFRRSSSSKNRHTSSHPKTDTKARKDSPSNSRAISEENTKTQTKMEPKRKSGWDAAEDTHQTQYIIDDAHTTHVTPVHVPTNTSASANPLCRIYVGSLDYHLTEEDIRQVFQSFGKINVIDMPKEGTRSKGFCFIEYSNPDSADMALRTMQGFTLKNRIIKVGRPTAIGALLGNVGNPNASLGLLSSLTNQNQLSSPFSAVNAGSLARLTAPTVTPVSPTLSVQNIKHDLKTASYGENQYGTPALSAQMSVFSRIYIGNVPFTFSTDDLRQIFQVFGPMVSCQLIPSIDQPGTHRGYGFIEYENPECAKLAIESMNLFKVNGKVLKVNYATVLKPTGPLADGTTVSTTMPVVHESPTGIVSYPTYNQSTVPQMAYSSTVIRPAEHFVEDHWQMGAYHH